MADNVSLGGVRVLLVKLFLASVSLGNTSFVFQRVRASRHDCCFSWSKIQGLRWRHGCSGRTLLDSARISYFFHSCYRFFLFPRRDCNHDIVIWMNSRKGRRSRCCLSRRSNLSILCWTCWSSASGSNLEWVIRCAGGSWAFESSFLVTSGMMVSNSSMQVLSTKGFNAFNSNAWRKIRKSSET